MQTELSEMQQKCSDNRMLLQSSEQQLADLEATLAQVQEQHEALQRVAEEEEALRQQRQRELEAKEAEEEALRQQRQRELEAKEAEERRAREAEQQRRAREEEEARRAREREERRRARHTEVSADWMPVPVQIRQRIEFEKDGTDMSAINLPTLDAVLQTLRTNPSAKVCGGCVRRSGPGNAVRTGISGPL